MVSVEIAATHSVHELLGGNEHHVLISFASLLHPSLITVDKEYVFVDIESREALYVVDFHSYIYY